MGSKWSYTGLSELFVLCEEVIAVKLNGVFELIKQTTQCKHAVSWASVMPMPQLFGWWLYCMYVLYTTSQRETDVMFWDVLSTELHLLSWIWSESNPRAQQVVPGWICRRAPKSVCAEEGLFPVEVEEWESIFWWSWFYPTSTCFFPFGTKKQFKVKIEDVCISAVSLCLSVQNKTFSKLLLNSMDEKKSFAHSREEGTE